MSDPQFQLEYAMPVLKRHWRESRRGKPFAEMIMLLLSVCAYGFAALFFIGLLAGALSLLTGSPFLGFPNILAGVVLLPTIAGAVASIRRRRAAAVLGYLEQAVRLNLPLNRVLIAAARSESRRTASRLIALKEDLEAGLTLADAMAEAVPEMPMRTLGLIDYATRIGRLGDTLNRLVGEDLQHSRRQRNDQAFAAWYPFLMIAMWCSVVGVLDVFVAPKFVQIFHDFKVPLPAVFQFIDSFGDYIWIICPLALLILLGSLGFQLRQTMHITAPIWILRRWWDRLLWYLPLLHQFILDRNISDICLSLADSTRLGYPLDSSVEQLTHLQLNSVTRWRVSTWSAGLRAGVPPAEAARHAHMPGLLVGMMSSARDTATLAEVFAFVGRFHTDRFLLRREAVRAAVVPVFTIFMGVVVAMVALSIFIPMQRLLDGVSKW